MKSYSRQHLHCARLLLYCAVRISLYFNPCNNNNRTSPESVRTYSDCLFQVAREHAMVSPARTAEHINVCTGTYVVNMHEYPSCMRRKLVLLR